MKIFFKRAPLLFLLTSTFTAQAMYINPRIAALIDPPVYITNQLNQTVLVVYYADFAGVKKIIKGQQRVMPSVKNLKAKKGITYYAKAGSDSKMMNQANFIHVDVYSTKADQPLIASAAKKIELYSASQIAKDKQINLYITLDKNKKINIEPKLP